MHVKCFCSDKLTKYQKSNLFFLCEFLMYTFLSPIRNGENKGAKNYIELLKVKRYKVIFCHIFDILLSNELRRANKGTYCSLSEIILIILRRCTQLAQWAYGVK